MTIEARQAKPGGARVLVSSKSFESFEEEGGGDHQSSLRRSGKKQIKNLIHQNLNSVVIQTKCPKPHNFRISIIHLAAK